MDKFNDALYLVDMYGDPYYPNFLVDKVKAALVKVVDLLESGERDMARIQAKFDAAMEEINDLEEEFDENDSEIETVARDSIGITVIEIIKHFGLDLDHETAMQQRDW
jgi:hypothetical protein